MRKSISRTTVHRSLTFSSSIFFLSDSIRLPPVTPRGSFSLHCLALSYVSARMKQKSLIVDVYTRSFHSFPTNTFLSFLHILTLFTRLSLSFFSYYFFSLCLCCLVISRGEKKRLVVSKVYECSNNSLFGLNKWMKHVFLLFATLNHCPYCRNINCKE